MIYPVETLKTQLQSHLKKDEPPKTKGAIVESAMVRTAKGMWKRGGMRAYYRGLTVSRTGVGSFDDVLTNPTGPTARAHRSVPLLGDRYEHIRSVKDCLLQVFRAGGAANGGGSMFWRLVGKYRCDQCLS